MTDSCGFLVLSHHPWPKRIILGFRGTYSITNAIVDLSIAPQEFVPYPDRTNSSSTACDNCTVHAGFMASWESARQLIIHKVFETKAKYPDYKLTLVGHSLGGAVAALAGLEFQLRGWKPHVTTFGEPKIGNERLAAYIDKQFGLISSSSITNNTGITGKPRMHSLPFWRVTHSNDPIPLLPFSEWGYRMHAGEIHISKVDLPPEVSDVHHCLGDADPDCISGSDAEGRLWSLSEDYKSQETQFISPLTRNDESQKILALIPRRLKLWELFFAHRDYFWRLGVCLPGGDPGGGWRWRWRWKLPWKD